MARELNFGPYIEVENGTKTVMLLQPNRNR